MLTAAAASGSRGRPGCAVPEGLTPAEVGKEVPEHKQHVAAGSGCRPHDRWLSILEALLLSLVAVLAAYSGYAAAKWGTESSVTLAKASASARRPTAPTPRAS